MATDKRQPWMKFHSTDWRGDAGLRGCSFAARGLWVDLLSLMHEATPYGHLIVNGKAPTAKRIAAMLGGTEKEVAVLLAELEEEGVFSRTEDGTIYSRRMVRDNAKAEQDRLNGKGGGNPKITKKSPGEDKGGVNPPDNQGGGEGDNGGDKARATRGPEARVRATPKPLQNFPAEVVPDSETGEPTVNGFRLNPIGEACLDAAGIDPARWRGDFSPVIGWLRDGYDGHAIARIIAKRAAKSGYSPPYSLQWFDAAIRQSCPLDDVRRHA